MILLNEWRRPASSGNPSGAKRPFVQDFSRWSAGGPLYATEPLNGNARCFPMSTTKNLSSMKSRLTIYKLGLRRAETHGNQDEITKWESSIAALEQEIDELDNQ